MRMQIHERERAKLEPMAASKATGDAIAWYCHMRLKKMMAEGVTQKDLSRAAQIPASAVSHLLKNGKGVGVQTLTGFANLFGFDTRGRLVDAADLWWESGGRAYALAEIRAAARERALQAEMDDTGERHVAKKRPSKSA